MDYELYSGNTKVALFHNYEPIKIYNLKLLPLYFQAHYNLESWLESRAIDSHRPSSRLLKKALHLKDYCDVQTVLSQNASTHKQRNRGDLDRQTQRVKEHVIYQNPINLQVISDVGSGLNDKRKGLEKLLKMIQNNEVNRLFICYKDRLTRFGFNYIKSICDFHHTDIVIVSNEELDKSVSEELAEDIISIIHSFSGKLYGMRRKVRDDICKELVDDGTGGKS